MNILVTGGAGFIGGHLVDVLVDTHNVFVYDSYEPQVHHGIPEYLNDKATYRYGRMQNRDRLCKFIVTNEIDVIYHLAAAVGVGQSMYEIRKYYESNVFGTATLLDILVKENHNVKKLIVASSMSTYGEGEYLLDDRIAKPHLRSDDQLKREEWDFPGIPIPTRETASQDCTSFYALTKKNQEKMCMLFGETYDIDVTALRFFNVYGSRQALSNPYTGVCAIFATSLLCGNSPLIFEDGRQTRDFVSVNDICQALLLVLDKGDGEVYNVGTGIPTSIKDVAQTLQKYINPNVPIVFTNEFRSGDIRHCFADISKIKSIGYTPTVEFEEGIIEFVDWVKKQDDVVDKISQARSELQKYAE